MGNDCLAYGIAEKRRYLPDSETTNIPFCGSSLHHTGSSDEQSRTYYSYPGYGLSDFYTGLYYLSCLRTYRCLVQEATDLLVLRTTICFFLPFHVTDVAVVTWRNGVVLFTPVPLLLRA